MPAAAKSDLLAQFKEMATAQRASLCGEHSDIRLDREIPHAVSASPASASVRQAGTDPLSAEKLRSAALRVGVLARSRPLTPAEVSDALARGRSAEAVVIIAHLAEEKPETLVQAIRGLGPIKNLALLVMRSADLSWSTAERLLREVGSAADHEGSKPASLDAASQREAYVALSCASAQRALQAVRLRAGFAVVEGGRGEVD